MCLRAPGCRHVEEKFDILPDTQLAGLMIARGCEMKIHVRTPLSAQRMHRDEAEAGPADALDAALPHVGVRAEVGIIRLAVRAWHLRTAQMVAPTYKDCPAENQQCSDTSQNDRRTLQRAVKVVCPSAVVP
jgi:hypothetical protein